LATYRKSFLQLEIKIRNLFKRKARLKQGKARVKKRKKDSKKETKKEKQDSKESRRIPKNTDIRKCQVKSKMK